MGEPRVMAHARRMEPAKEIFTHEIVNFTKNTLNWVKCL